MDIQSIKKSNNKIGHKPNDLKDTEDHTTKCGLF